MHWKKPRTEFPRFLIQALEKNVAEHRAWARFFHESFYDAIKRAKALIEDKSCVVVEITTHLSMIIMPHLAKAVVTIEKPLTVESLNETSSQEVPKEKDPLSKGKEVVRLGPKRRSQRTKSKKVSYQVDNASEDANNQGAKASHALGLEDYKAFEFAEAGPSQFWKEMVKVQWESIVEFEVHDQELLKNHIGLEAVGAKMKVVGHCESYKVMM